MPRFYPLTNNLSDQPVLFIDAQASVDDLHDCACTRVRVATHLLESLASMTLHETCDRDVGRFANAAFMLLRDGCDVLEVISNQRLRQNMSTD